MLQATLRYAWFLCALLTVAGCARWTSVPLRDASPLAPAPMSPDSVVVEVAFVQLPAEQGPEFEEELWAEVDEQHLPLVLRTALGENGLRSGVCGATLPLPVRQALERSAEVLPVNGDVEQLQTFQKRIQSPAGRRNPIVLSRQPRDLVALTSVQGHASGHTYHQAQCTFDLRTFPQGDGRVQLQLTPEIEYGPPRTRFVGNHEHGTMLVDSGRDKRVFQEARIETMLSPGQTLLIGCTPRWKALGSSFLVDDSSGQPVERLLLIRLAQTQFQDVFAPGAPADPLVTPAE